MMLSKAVARRRNGGLMGRGVQGQQARSRGRTLGIETLEGRRVLAVNSFIYGIDNNNNIQQININGQSATQVYTNSPNGTIPAGDSNAFAYDTARDQFFFIDSNNNLEFWARTGDPTVLVSASNLGLPTPATTTNQPQNAVFYNDAYWFFDEGTNVLNKVPFTYLGGVPTFDDVLNPRVTYAITGAPTTTNTFGDIAVNASGVLYAATQDGQFYSVDISGSTPSAATSIATGNPSMQLSFSSDYNTLYGQTFAAVTFDSVDYPAGQWFTINTGTGVPTAISGFAISYAGGNGLRDLGGAANEAAPALTIVKDDGVTNVFAGDGVTYNYTITVTNIGQVAADDVVVTDDNWPAGFVQGAVTAPADTTFTAGTGGNFTWTFDVPLAAGASQTLIVPYTVPFGTAAGPRQNTASVTSPGDPEKHESTDTTNVVSNALVAANDLGCVSTPRVYVINPYSTTPTEVFSSFIAYPDTPSFRGGIRVAVGDVDADGFLDVVTAPGPGRRGDVKVFNLDGTPKAGFTQPYLPFGTGYRDGIEINVGDIDGDGDDDLVASKSRGPGEVQVAKSSGTAFTAFRTFTAFGGTYRGGASAAFGSRLSDDTVAVVVGSGPGMKPTVKNYVMNTNSGAVSLSSQYNPVMPAGTAGVSVTTLRYAGGVLDTLVAAGRNGNSKVSVYQGGSNVNRNNYSTFSSLAKPNAPVFAAASSLKNADGTAQAVFMAQGDGGVNTIKKVNATTGVVDPTFAPLYLGKPLVSPLRVATNTPRVADN